MTYTNLSVDSFEALFGDYPEVWRIKYNEYKHNGDFHQNWSIVYDKLWEDGSSSMVEVVRSVENLRAAVFLVTLHNNSDRIIKGLRALDIVERFVDYNNISVVETIYQTDKVIENAYELIEHLCTVSGYKERKNED